MARSNSANTPSIWNIALPAGVVVSSPCWFKNRSEIALVSGLTPDPTGGNPGFTTITGNNTVTQNIVKVGAATAIGILYRLNITATARDCDCRETVLPYCVMISVAQC
jgi:hypothetical protein